MKLYQAYKSITDKIKPIDTAWFTTFNLDVELVEKFLLSQLIDKAPIELKTAEDYEGMNLELKGIDIKVWYDYRAMNTQSPKRTTVDFISTDPRSFFDSKSHNIVFHPKVIFLKGKGGAYLLSGSANLSISAWSTNKEAVMIKEIMHKENADEIIGFFDSLFTKNGLLSDAKTPLSAWRNKLSGGTSGWNFLSIACNRKKHSLIN
ncbi:MAG: hypothetical protein IPP15_16175 [Saprospiraceae bacterium]|uniref:Phospholipase D-like domain-containing protein n=1 Tax=Candidatus Opimibacter skivensis TaxID=2982028 RepID=A0A9D7SV64_9BACT|nr:hypothetical protein [Candidatus Opimibacter skivensis]